MYYTPNCVPLSPAMLIAYSCTILPTVCLSLSCHAHCLFMYYTLNCVTLLPCSLLIHDRSSEYENRPAHPTLSRYMYYTPNCVPLSLLPCSLLIHVLYSQLCASLSPAMLIAYSCTILPTVCLSLSCHAHCLFRTGPVSMRIAQPTPHCPDTCTILPTVCLSLSCSCQGFTKAKMFSRGGPPVAFVEFKVHVTGYSIGPFKWGWGAYSISMVAPVQ